MQTTTIHKITIALLLPVLGAFLSAGIMYKYFTVDNASHDTIYVAAQASMLSTELHAWTHMVLIGQEEDREGLKDRMDRFDTLLEVLHSGGTIDAFTLAPASEEIQSVLSDVTARWKLLRPVLTAILEQETSTAEGKIRARALYTPVNEEFHQLPDLVNRIITTCDNNHEHLGTSMTYFLLLVILADIVLLVMGITALRAYVRDREATELVLSKQAQIIDQIHEAVVSTDLDGKITYWNQGAERVFGYTTEEMLHTPVARVYAPEEYTSIHENIFKQVRTHGTRQVEVKFMRKSGEQFYALLSTSLLRDTAGQESGMISYTIDITTQKQAQIALQKSEERFRSLVEASSDFIYELDSNGFYTYVSPQLMQILGYNRDDILGNSMFDLIHPEDAPIARKKFWEFRNQQKSYNGLEYRFWHKLGHLVVLESSAEPFFDSSGKLLGYHGIDRDVTQRKQTQEALNKLAYGVTGTTGEEFFRSLVLHLTKMLNVDYALVVETDCTVEPMGKTIVVCHHDKLLDNFQYALMGTPCQNVVTGIMCCYTKDVAQQYPDDDLLIDMKAEAYLGVPLMNSAGQVMGILAAISTQPITNPEFAQMVFQLYASRAAVELERKQNESRLQYLAHFDHLTKLPNRVLFMDRLHNALARAQWRNRLVAVIFLDLDRFKLINDTLGHSVGDELLKEAGQRLSYCVRDGDSVARLGGDEFVILLNDLARREDIPVVAEKIIQVFSQSFEHVGKELFVSTSIGISVYPHDGSDATTLMKHADIAMYQAKAQGRNTYCIYQDTMDQRSDERLKLENDLRRALGKNEFEIFYQPKINLQDGRINGVEALLRWHHAKLGMLSPLEFIPILEETGLLLPVGTWVIDTACKQMRDWLDQGLAPHSIAVNVANIQFRQSNFVELIAESINRYELSPGMLELEITENSLIDQNTSMMLRKLHDHGVNIAIDDFGTGYSSLSYLKSHPISSLKIDYTFIRDIITDSDDAAITRAVIAMAHSLRLNVIAEGVETKEQLDFLVNCGCNEVQGFYFSQPVPADSLRNLMQRFQISRVPRKPKHHRQTG